MVKLNNKTRRAANKSVPSKKEEASKPEAGKLSAKFAGLAFHNCEVSGGRKFPEGTEVVCVAVYLSKWGKPTARILFENEDGDQTTGFIDPRFLEKGEPISKADKAELEAQKEADSESVSLFLCSVQRESEKAVMLDAKGWWAPRWFPKSMVTLHKGEYGTAAEIPSWKVRKDLGQDTFAAIEKNQASVQKLVDGE